MAVISARSPFIVSINEASQIGSKIEIFLWNGTTEPSPNNAKYTLSKLIPASNNTLTTYDVSPYILEYITHDEPESPTTIQAHDTTQWCNVRIKRYKLINSTYTLLDTTDYFGFDGWTYYEEGSNVEQGGSMLDEKTYYYNEGNYAGELVHYMVYVNGSSRGYAVYTKPDLSASTTIYSTSSGWKSLPRVHPSYTATGNILKLYNLASTLLATYTFLPVCEPKYTPVVVDFINQYGSWQREFFFKASKNTLNIESTDFNVMQSSITSYDVKQGQKKSFNTNARETISVNSGYVNEDFSSNIKQLLMSERVLVDNKPAICKTKSLELMKNINNHMINYSLEFEFAYNTINAVI